MDDQTKQAIFDQLQRLVQQNVPDDFAMSEVDENRFDVDTQKAVVIAGKERPNMNLLSVIVQKHHVGFYFMPVYVDEALRDTLPELLAKMLKGKSCFHVKKKLSPEREQEIAKLIQSGVVLYKQRDWI